MDMNTICEDHNKVIDYFVIFTVLKISKLPNDCMYMISYCLIEINYKFCDIMSDHNWFSSKFSDIVFE